jgi:cytochrome c oxidase cbb3-type subunit 3
MVAWQSSINPVKMQEITSYILSMQGTNPPGAKEPQGEKYIPNDAGTISTDSLTKN